MAFSPTLTHFQAAAPIIFGVVVGGGGGGGGGGVSICLFLEIKK